MKHLSSIFKNIACAPDPSLEGRVLSALRAERARLLRWQNRLAIGSVAASVVLFASTMFFLGTALVQSEFWSLLTLLFSDLGVIATSGGDFVSSLLETVPLVPLIALFAPLTLFFFSMSFLLSLGERETPRGLVGAHS